MLRASCRPHIRVKDFFEENPAYLRDRKILSRPLEPRKTVICCCVRGTWAVKTCSSQASSWRIERKSHLDHHGGRPIGDYHSAARGILRPEARLRSSARGDHGVGVLQGGVMNDERSGLVVAPMGGASTATTGSNVGGHTSGNTPMRTPSEVVTRTWRTCRFRT